MTEQTPFHAGERAVQTRMGVREQIEPWARRVVRSHMPEEHQAFYAGLQFAVLAARDTLGRPWATLLTGGVNFIDAPDAQTLRLGTRLLPGDALQGSLAPGADVGILGIEFDTRRRNRVNGRISECDAQGFSVAVDQSFGNCPQHIRPRTVAAFEQGDPGEPRVTRSLALSETSIRWIKRADTFLIATGHRDTGECESFGMDVSHRGGEPGFVQVVNDHKLVFPDFSGNNHFNTIGNLVMDPRVGLLFIDFESGHLLQISGRASIDWDSPAVAQTPGATRLVSIAVDAVVVLESVLPIRWQMPQSTSRLMRVVLKRRESTEITSFLLQTQDGSKLPPFKPGQHLPVEVTISGAGQPVARTYSLSCAPDPTHYRLSIKRESHGVVSQFLHTSINPGDTLSTRAPAGDFVLKANSRTVVLVSAGVGITPMLSMFGSLALEPTTRDVWFIHGARDGAHHAFAQEVRNIAATNPALHTHVSYSRPLPDDVAGKHYDHAGRITADLLASLLPVDDADFYVCGPVAFMGEVMGGLASLGVPDDRLMSESFGA